MNKIIFILLIIISFSSRAQYFNQTPSFLKANSVWALGDSCGLDFNSIIPLPITTGMYYNREGCASVADSSGKLLFYMGNNGIIYNRNHQPMLNGTGINPEGAGSSTQGALIVPVIDTPWKYYAFTNASAEYYISGGQPPYLAYSIVDMTLDNGLGGVEPGRKNIPIETVDALSEGMIAIPGDRCDIWLLTYVSSTSYQGFKAWNISSTGIAATPVISPQPFMTSGVFSLAVSSDRKKVAASFCNDRNTNEFGGILLCRFDASMGKVYDSIPLERFSFDLPNVLLGVKAACFSPDNSKLYLNVMQVFTGGSYIEQLDISTYTPVAIQSSAYRIDTGTSQLGHFDLKLYNDTIYTMFGEPAFNTYATHFSRIVNPNAAGSACGFQHQVINLPKPRVSWYCLPNSVVFPFSAPAAVHRIVDTVICKGQISVLKAADQFYGYEWDNGATFPTRTINGPGVYWVRYYNSGYVAFRCEEYIDTFFVELLELNPIINVNGFDLSTTAPYNTYQWYLNGVLIPGATDSIYSVKENGDYTVVVSDENGCTDTSDVYKVTNWTSVFDPGNIAQYIHVYPNPANDLIYIKSPEPVQAHLYGIDGRSLIQVSDAAEIPISMLPEGIYVLRIMDKDGRMLKVEKIRKQ